MAVGSSDELQAAIKKAVNKFKPKFYILQTLGWMTEGEWGMKAYAKGKRIAGLPLDDRTEILT